MHVDEATGDVIAQYVPACEKSLDVQSTEAVRVQF
jgi:hypothetical protein